MCGTSEETTEMISLEGWGLTLVHGNAVGAKWPWSGCILKVGPNRWDEKFHVYEGKINT